MRLTYIQEKKMRNMKIAVAVTALAMLSACANMTPGEKGAAVGATAGGVIGNVITGGGVLGTLGGAAVGGVVGSEVGKRR